jgi:hypothetical protein
MIYLGNWEDYGGEEKSNPDEIYTYICIGLKFIYYLETGKLWLKR